MSDENTKALIENLPAIIAALASLVAAIFAGFGFKRSGKNAVAIEAMRQENAEGRQAEKR